MITTTSQSPCFFPWIRAVGHVVICYSIIDLVWCKPPHTCCTSHAKHTQRLKFRLLRNVNSCIPHRQHLSHRKDHVLNVFMIIKTNMQCFTLLEVLYLIMYLFMADMEECHFIFLCIPQIFREVQCSLSKRESREGDSFMSCFWTRGSPAMWFQLSTTLNNLNIWIYKGKKGEKMTKNCGMVIKVCFFFKFKNLSHKTCSKTSWAWGISN